MVLAMTYSRNLVRLLPSALKGLTAVFGMGTGVTPSLESPELWHSLYHNDVYEHENTTHTQKTLKVFSSYIGVLVLLG